MSLLDQLMTYILVAETHSFTAAADKLLISSNAVNKQVSQLEQQLNLTLLSRSTRRLRLTDVGLDLYKKAKNVQIYMDDISKYAQSLQRDPSGVLSVVSTVGVGQDLITPHLSKFLEAYPNLKLNLEFSDRFPDLNNSLENIDIAYGFSKSSFPEKFNLMNLVRKKLFPIERIVCAAPSYLAKYGEPKTYEDLKNHCLIMHTQIYKNALIKECAKRSIQFSRTISVNNTASILKLVLNGNGIASTPDLVCKHQLASGELKRILLIHQEPKINTYLFYLQSRYVPAKIKCFVDFFSR
ncbi:MAG: LysR family transcriptional regulator [Proteobacteria bacterium]|nr:LysR family transcriptional regulator [Pseudomonadota bacterium]